MLKVKDKKWYLDYSFFDKKGYQDFSSKLKLNSDKSSKAFRVFFKNLSTFFEVVLYLKLLLIT